MPDPILDYQKPDTGPKEPQKLGPIEWYVQWFFVCIAMGLVGFAAYFIFVLVRYRASNGSWGAS